MNLGQNTMFVGFLLVPEALENALNELALSCLAGEIRFFAPISLPDKKPPVLTLRVCQLGSCPEEFQKLPSNATSRNLACARKCIPGKSIDEKRSCSISSSPPAPFYTSSSISSWLGVWYRERRDTSILISGPVRRHRATPPTTPFAHGPNSDPRDASSCSHSLLVFHLEKVIYLPQNQICRTAARAARHP
ncbi:hypothetical protein QC762_0069650 [Podospora pseudocomata]|uniref:Uncharacterized protein n=1 Tax=Podospora pseudocomata TaxID=2093779 RepID=A0ABR0GGG0_9PEZI|nr:hypothetical protein QC762_0069650 [Podospora pseudocomata]